MKKRLIYFMICLLGSGITAQAQYTYTLSLIHISEPTRRS